MPPRILFVDVGTHMAQEYTALFETGRWRYWWNFLKNRERAWKKGSPKMPRDAFDRMLADAAWLRARRADFFYVMVEPNPNLFALPIYRRADLALNTALLTNAATTSLLPLFFSQGNRTGQGSSLFAAKPNVDTSDFQQVLALDALHFVQMLKSMFDEVTQGEDYRVILRLNNEGAEVEVIKAFEGEFGKRLSAVLGSLLDVGKIKGQAELDKLYAFLAGKDIPFLPLSPVFASWAPAMALIRKRTADLIQADIRG